KEVWHEDEARVWKYSHISPNHGRKDSNRFEADRNREAYRLGGQGDFRRERVERVYQETRVVSPDDRIKYTELPRNVTGGQQVGNYYVVRRNIKNHQWRDGDRYRADQLDDSNKPRRTEILYIRSPIHDPDVHILRYGGEADDEEIFRSVSQQENIRERQEQRDSRSYDALRQPRKIIYRDESDPTDQQLKFSRYHRTNSDVYIPNMDGDILSRPVQNSRTQAAWTGNFTIPKEKTRRQIIQDEDFHWRDKFEVEENEKPQRNSGIQNTFHVTEQPENIHQRLEPQDRITLVYGEYKQHSPDVDHSQQRIDSYQMTSNDATHWTEPSANPNMTRREIIREYRYSNNEMDQRPQNNHISTQDLEDKARISQENEKMYIENYSGQQKLEDVIQGNKQGALVNPVLTQKEIITEYRYSNNEMDQRPQNNHISTQDQEDKTRISQENEKIYIENYSGQQKLEDVIQGNKQGSLVNPVLTQKEIITEYRYSNNDMDQRPQNNQNSAKDEMDKTKIGRMDNENYSKHEADESINQTSESNVISPSDLSNQLVTSREIQKSFMINIQPQNSTSETHVVKESRVTHVDNNVNTPVEQKENNSNNFLVYREAPLIIPGQTNHQGVPQ
ncbi:uncharacterized protein DDB_G0287625-like, partial [Limulus polyphemus]|uniref:Uncharacterized protein DDB_G0287625-like n=1 Tax=Limulus polyphemus TaxID=6850 RepID=A0ABM1C1Z4_LIMPO